MVKFCPRCGYQNPDYAGFCVKCGYQFPTSQQPPYNQTSNSPNQPYQSTTPPNQPNPPPPYYQQPYQKKNFPIKAIIGVVIAVIAALVVIVVVVPLFTGGAHSMLTTSQADSIFGGSWAINQGETGNIRYSGNGQYVLVLSNGSTIPLGSPQVGSLGTLDLTSGYVETLTGNISNVGTNLKIMIIEVNFANSQQAAACFNELSSTEGYISGAQKGSVNGYQYIYAQGIIVAYQGSTMIGIETYGFTPTETQMVSALSDIT